MQEFEGRVAVVTGAASGVGRAMATRFATAGASAGRGMAGKERWSVSEVTAYSRRGAYPRRGEHPSVPEVRDGPRFGIAFGACRGAGGDAVSTEESENAQGGMRRE